MKKLLSILIVPLVAILMLCGCGRTMRTVDEVTKLFEQNVNKYNEANIQGSQTNNNWYFKDNSYVLRVVYDNEAELNKMVNTVYSNENDASVTNLQYKFLQLRTVYERELAMIYAYYDYFAKSFYENISAKEIKEEEVTNLYDKVRDMFKQLESFNSSKIDLEREVKLYGIDSNILLASLDKFNYAYNGLVRKSLDMVEYFRDLHYNYFFKDANQYDDAYLNQMYYDSLLCLAEFIYNDYLQPLTQNGVVTLVDVRNSIEDYFNIFKVKLDAENNETNLFNKIVKTTTPVTVSKASTGTTEAKIRQFENSLNTFKQYYKLYLKAFAKINVQRFYDLRYQRNGVTIEDFADKNGSILDLSEFTNMNVVEDFESTSVENLLKAVYEIIVK